MSDLEDKLGVLIFQVEHSDRIVNHHSSPAEDLTFGQILLMLRLITHTHTHTCIYIYIYIYI